MATRGYWTPARKRAFAKMRAGLSKSRRRRPGTKVRRKARRLRNPMTALVANPRRPRVGYSRAYAAGYGATFGAPKRRKRRKPSKGKKTMARRKKRTTRKAAPRRRGTKRRVIRRARRVPKSRAHRYYKARGKRKVYLNGKRRRRSRRRNPGTGRGGIMGAIKAAFVPYAVGAVTGALSAFIDSKTDSKPAVRALVKAGASVAIAMFGRRYPRASAAAIGALGASTGYSYGTKLLGGMVASTPAAAVKGLGEMAETYPEMGALLQGGIGALLQGPTDVDDVASNYATALNNGMSDDDDDA